MKTVRDSFAPETRTSPGPHVGTRHRVIGAILENGPSSAADLARDLGLTPAAVRRHLDALVAEGVVAVRPDRVSRPRSRGRPAKVFAITDAGRDALYQAYDDLATSALRFLADRAGPSAVSEFARQRLAQIEHRYRQVIQQRPGADRAHALAEALSADGYAATAIGGSAAGGQQLCQHHCPVVHVATQFPQLCEAETEIFGRLLGTHVQRLATIAHGDGVCTTYVPLPTRVTATAPPVSGRTAV